MKRQSWASEMIPREMALAAKADKPELELQNPHGGQREGAGDGEGERGKRRERGRWREGERDGERERTRTDALKLSPDLHMWPQHEHLHTQ